VRCSEASEQWGKSDLGEIVLGDLGDGVEYRDILWEMYNRALSRWIKQSIVLQMPLIKESLWLGR
jgi:hypothetical protein